MLSSASIRGEAGRLPRFRRPGLGKVSEMLSAAFAADRLPSRRVEIVNRARSRFQNTFPSEIVTCVPPSGRTRRLLLKYETGGRHRAHGHRGGLPYEAEIYRRLLARLQDWRPRFYGAPMDDATGRTWLILEYLDRSVRVRDIPVDRERSSGRPPLVRAAQWIARFHAAHEPRRGDGTPSFLRCYDLAYYRGWARRLWEFAEPLRGRFPWLKDVCEGADRCFAHLLASPQTVIHGEYYANNILLWRGAIRPVDWESAAVGPGEIDLAALVEGAWPRTIVRRCERAYARARWPDGPPPGSAPALDAARMYLHFRWLGDRPAWTRQRKLRWRFHELHAVASRLGLLRRTAARRIAVRPARPRTAAGGET